MYLGAPTCIAYQDTFGNRNPWDSLVAITQGSQLIEPNYKEYVSPAALRRMSTVLKMGAASGKECLQSSGLDHTDAIIVGTGLGCVRDTLKFLRTVYEGNEAGLSPTAFIQSTHNSIAGQLALMLENHGYNMTHVQGALSLGCALSDAQLLIDEGDAETVLVGAADEKTEELLGLLEELAATFQYPLPVIGEGAAFFLASKDKLASSVAKVIGLTMISDPEPKTSNEVFENADLVISNSAKGFNYTRFSGEHFTSIGFGLFMALKAFEAKSVDNEYATFHDPNRILVHQELFGQQMSILLEKV